MKRKEVLLDLGPGFAIAMVSAFLMIPILLGIWFLLVYVVAKTLGLDFIKVMKFALSGGR